MRKRVLGSWLKFISFILFTMIIALISKSAVIAFFALSVSFLLFISAAFTYVGAKRITLSFEAPPSFEKNAAKNITLRMENGGKLPFGRLLCIVLAENRLCGESEEILLETSSGGKDKGSTSFTLCSGHCGHMAISIKKAYITDWLGLFMKRIENPATTEMSILPDTFVPQIDISIPPLTPFDDDSYSPDKKGYDLSEVFQLREYEEQDSLRQIHWKLSGKLDKLIVRDGSLPVARNILVYWDKNTRDTSPSEIDAMAELLCSICQGLCDMGVKYDLGYSLAQGCRIEEIEDTEGLLEVIPSMFKEPCREDILSGVEKYTEQYGRALYGKVICLCAGLPNGLETFASSNLTLISIDDCPAGEYSVINMHPGNYREELANIGL